MYTRVLLFVVVCCCKSQRSEVMAAIRAQATAQVRSQRALQRVHAHDRARVCGLRADSRRVRLYVCALLAGLRVYAQLCVRVWPLQLG